MSKISPTEAGQIDSHANRNDLIDSINQIFALFRINFHNQYYKAYPDVELLNQAKKLWLESLKNFDSRTLLNATKRIIEEQEYLPTLHQMLTFCAMGDSYTPSPHQAYVEACQASSPKAQYDWSHPAVYEAGRRSDWFFLGTTPEHLAFPVYKDNYGAVLKELGKGLQLEIPKLENLYSSVNSKPIGKKEGLAKIKLLRKKLSAEIKDS